MDAGELLSVWCGARGSFLDFWTHVFRCLLDQFFEDGNQDRQRRPSALHGDCLFSPLRSGAHDLFPALPFKQVPILEVDGKVIPQSLAQLRYVGKIGGIYPENALEAANADAAMDAVTDLQSRFLPTLWAKDHDKKMELRKEFVEYLALWLGNLEHFLEEAGGKYFSGGKLSTGDIAVVARLNWLKDGTLEGVPTTMVDEYSLLSALVDRVMSEPRIVAYVEKLPEPVVRQF